MAPLASNRSQKDDFILTISDDESGLTNSEAEDSPISPETSISKSSKKRKRGTADKDGAAVSKSAPKSKKRKRKGDAKGSEDDDDDHLQEDGWAAGGEDDGAMNPDFEFSIDRVEGELVSGLDGWDLPKEDRNAEGVHKNAVNVEDIVERRRGRNAQTQLDADIESQSEGEDLHSNGESHPGFEDQDDELLADDTFGMGAAREDESEDDPDDSSEAKSDYRDGDENSAELNGEIGDEDVAFPMPNPDDALSSASSEDEAENPVELAKREAFFAPEKNSASKSLTKSKASFQTMALSRPILKGLTAIGFTSPTPIQTKAVPVALLGKDVVGGAVTGSGKTGAFIIPILERLLFRPKKVSTTRVAILMPTRELAVQCFNVANKMAAFTDITFALTVGGLSLRDQEQTLKKRPDVVIATPGRFIDHVRNSASFAVESVEILVLDEADRMLEDGFADELNEILSLIPRSRQTMLFSATMTQDVDKLIRLGMNRPVRLMVDEKKRTVQGLVQEFIKMKGNSSESEEERRLACLVHLCRNIYTSKTIVFFASKALTHRVKVLLLLNGVKAAELHGSMSQEQRLNAITSFRDGQSTHLLATDLASRGLDIPKVETVLNFTVPTTSTIYLHRVGRTARAGRVGVACTMFSSATSSTSSTRKLSKASERTLLKPIIRLAKNQSASIRTRSLPLTVMNELAREIHELQPEIDAILLEEKEERLIQQLERDATKGENLVKFEDEIASRPRRTWFQGEKDKKTASSQGMNERKGIESGQAIKTKVKRKLSGNEKKKLLDRDERKNGEKLGWKKQSEERAGRGVLQKSSGSKKKSSKGGKSKDGKHRNKPSKMGKTKPRT